MDELLQKLVESELLTEDTKKQLEETLSRKMEEKAQQIREEAEAEVKTDLAEKYAQDKEELVEAMDTALEKALNEEVAELKEDIERFRDLEAEYAEKLVETRQQMAENVKNDMTKLLEGLDAYVDQRLHAELDELRESIEDVRKENHGRKILETIGEEYRRMFTEEDDYEQKVLEKEEALNKVNEQLKEAKDRLRSVEREQKMEDVLESLSGQKREVMAAILQGIPTERLDEAYRRYIGKVLRESNEDSSEKDNSVLAEGKNEENTDSDDFVVATGDSKVVVEDVDTITESVDGSPNYKLDEITRNRLKILSGIS